MTTKAAVSKAINRFRLAVEDHAFIGTIPRYESEDAEAYALSIEYELKKAEKALRALIERIAAK